MMKIMMTRSMVMMEMMMVRRMRMEKLKMMKVIWYDDNDNVGTYVDSNTNEQ